MYARGNTYINLYDECFHIRRNDYVIRLLLHASKKTFPNRNYSPNINNPMHIYVCMYMYILPRKIHLLQNLLSSVFLEDHSKIDTTISFGVNEM